MEILFVVRLTYYLDLELRLELGYIPKLVLL